MTCSVAADSGQGDALDDALGSPEKAAGRVSRTEVTVSTGPSAGSCGNPVGTLILDAPAIVKSEGF